MRSRLKRVAIGAAIVGGALAILVLVGSFVARQVASRTAEQELPAPGRMVDVGSRRAHIYCSGVGSPTLLLESGMDTSGSWSWESVREELSGIARVCAYDRAGILWSEPGEDPRDALSIAAELHDILSAAAERPPYVMVGHSLGGALIRVYDQMYPGESVGFIFVDSSHPDQEDRFPSEVRRLSSISRFLPTRLLGRILAPYLSLIDRDSPPMAFLWRSTEGVASEASAMARTLEQARATGTLGDRPVIVLSAGEAPWMPLVSEEVVSAMHRTTLELHEELAALSSNSDHRVVEGAGHYIHWDQPEAVIDAIRDVVDAVREEGSVGN